MSAIKANIAAASTDAMRARQRDRVKALRLVNAALKQVEIDERKELTDADVLTVLAKMCKQRRDSLAHFSQAGRDDLAAIEQYEIDVICEFMPASATPGEIDSAIASAIASTGANSMRDMGKVMAALKAELAGRTDMGAVSSLVRAALDTGAP